MPRPTSLRELLDDDAFNALPEMERQKIVSKVSETDQSYLALPVEERQKVRTRLVYGQGGSVESARPQPLEPAPPQLQVQYAPPTTAMPTPAVDPETGQRLSANLPGSVKSMIGGINTGYGQALGYAGAQLSEDVPVPASVAGTVAPGVRTAADIQHLVQQGRTAEIAPELPPNAVERAADFMRQTGERMIEENRRPDATPVTDLGDVINDPVNAFLTMVEQSGPTVGMMVPAIAASAAGAPMSLVAIAQSLTEMAMEAGQAQDQAVKEGKSRDSAQRIADRAFIGNAPIAVTNMVELPLIMAKVPKPLREPMKKVLEKIPDRLLTRMGMGTLRMLAESYMEGEEEAYQDAIQDWAKGQGFDYNPLEQTGQGRTMGRLMGLLLGGPASVADVAGQTIEKGRRERIETAIKDFTQRPTIPVGRNAPSAGEIEKVRWEEAPDFLPKERKDKTTPSVREAWAAGNYDTEKAAAKYGKNLEGGAEAALQLLQEAEKRAQARLSGETVETMRTEQRQLEEGSPEAQVMAEIGDHYQQQQLEAPAPIVPKTQLHRDVSAFIEEHGFKPLLYLGNGESTFEGYYNENHPDVVAVDVNAPAEALVVQAMGHEIAHGLKRKFPDAWRVMANWLRDSDRWAEMEQDTARLYQDRQLTPEELEDETVSRFTQKHMPEALSVMARRASAEKLVNKPGATRRLVEYLRKLMDKVRTMIGLKGTYKSDREWTADMLKLTEPFRQAREQTRAGAVEETRPTETVQPKTQPEAQEAAQEAPAEPAAQPEEVTAAATAPAEQEAAAEGQVYEPGMMDRAKELRDQAIRDRRLRERRQEQEPIGGEDTRAQERRLKPVEEMSREELIKELHTDLRTRLPNARAFMADHYDNPTSHVGFVDVDGLGVTNELFGHAGGNRLLRTLANALKKVSEDLKISAYRLHDGGDEFVIAGSNAQLKKVRERLDQILEGTYVEDTYKGTPVRLPVIFSMGVARRGQGELEEILDAADKVLTADKKQRAAEGKRLPSGDKAHYPPGALRYEEGGWREAGNRPIDTRPEDEGVRGELKKEEPPEGAPPAAQLPFEEAPRPQQLTEEQKKTPPRRPRPEKEVSEEQPLTEEELAEVLAEQHAEQSAAVREGYEGIIQMRKRARRIGISNRLGKEGEEYAGVPLGFKRKDSPEGVDEHLDHAKSRGWMPPDATTSDFIDALKGPLPQFALRAGQFSAKDVEWSFPNHEGFMDLMRRKIQDRFLRVKRVQEAIEKRGVTIQDEYNVYLIEEQFYGRLQDEIDKLDRRVIQPLIRFLSEQDIKITDFEKFLLARHAKERNAYLKEIHITRPRKRLQEELSKLKDHKSNIYKAKMQELAAIDKMERVGQGLVVMKDGDREWIEKGVPYSGMTDEEADAHLAELEEKGLLTIGRRPAKDEPMLVRKGINQELYGGSYGEAGKLFDALIREKTVALLRYGLVTQEEADDVLSRYDFYAPLKGREIDGETLPGDLEDLFGPDVAKLGKGFDIRGEEFKYGLGRYSKAKNPILSQAVIDTYEAINRGEKNKVGEALLGLIEKNPNEQLWEINKEFQKFVYNKKTGEAVSVPDNWLSREADNVLAVKREGTQYYIHLKDAKLARAMKNLGAMNLGKVLRGFAFINRGLAAVNTSLNPEFIISNLMRDLQEAKINLTEEELQRIKVKLRDVGKSGWGIFKELRGGIPTEWSKYFGEYKESGAMIGFFGLKDVQQQAADLAKRWKQIGKNPTARAWKAAYWAADLIEDANRAVENSIRLVAYVKAREAGISRLKSASIARNLTVNFNRKGEAGQVLNALYMFANASIQGNARLLSAMARSPRLRKIATGISMSMMGLAMYNRWTWGDDEDGIPYIDKIPGYVRNGNLMIAAPGTKGGGSSIPAPYGYNVFIAAGNMMESLFAKAMGQSDKKLTSIAWDMTSAIFDAFNPLGAADPIRMLTPTAFDTPIDLARNETWYGAPARPDGAFDDRPASQKYFRSVTPVSKAIMEWLHEVTGGSSQYRKGLVEFSPENLDYIMAQATGGLGKFILNLGNTALHLKEGEFVVDEFPFLRRLWKQPQPYWTSTIYYEMADEMDTVNKENNNLTGEKRREFMQEHGWKVSLLDSYRETSKGLKQAREKRDEDEEGRLMQRFILMYQRASRRTR